MKKINLTQCVRHYTIIPGRVNLVINRLDMESCTLKIV